MMDGLSYAPNGCWIYRAGDVEVAIYPPVIDRGRVVYVVARRDGRGAGAACTGLHEAYQVAKRLAVAPLEGS